MTKKIRILEELVNKLTKNLTHALDKVAPIKMINLRREVSPWKLDEELIRQKETEKTRWDTWRLDPSETNKRAWQEEKERTNRMINSKRSSRFSCSKYIID